MRHSLKATHKILAIMAVAAASILATGVITSSASAASSAPTRADHCVVNVSARSAQCYDTLQAAKAAGLRIARGADSKTAAADKSFANQGAQRSQSRAAASVAIATYYDLPFQISWFGTLTFYAPAGCTTSTADTDWIRNELASLGWNDRISSFTSYSNCWTKLYEHDNFGGSGFGYMGSASTLGAMDNESSSITWS